MNELINRYQNLIVAIFVVLAIAYGSYNYIYKPKLKEIDGLVSSLKMIDTEIMSIKGGDLLLKDLRSAKDVLKKELADVSLRIPYEKESPYLINNFISVVGKGLNIDYNLIQPQAIVQEGKYKRLPLRVEFEGDYSNLNTYLSQLKNLPVTIRVDSMELKKITGSRKLSVILQLSAFVMPGGSINPNEKAVNQGRSFDPFYKPEYRAANKTTTAKRTDTIPLKYTGYWIGKRIQAIINDEVVKVGDTIQGYKVSKIYKDKVVLIKNGNTIELPLVRTK
jgi:Tfp pilus assembly protein PilO